MKSRTDIPNGFQTPFPPGHDNGETGSLLGPLTLQKRTVLNN